MFHCHICHKDVAPDALSCPGCGLKNPKLRPCKSCGKTIAVDSKACPHCGQAYPAMSMNPETVSGLVVGVITVVGLVYFWDDIVAYYKAVFDLYNLLQR